MQTATISAFDQYADLMHAARTGNDINVAPGGDDSVTHYVFYPGEDIPYAEVVTGYVKRGSVTPILAFPKWDRAQDVPDGMRKATRGIQIVSGESEPIEAMYEIAPNNIFNHLLEKYGHWGVTELSALAGWRPDQVKALDIDNVFFPNGIPDTYREMKARIGQAASEVPKDHPQRDAYRKIAEDMLLAIARSESYDKAFVDEVEANIERSKSSDKWQSTYCKPSLRALARLERTRKDDAVNTVARRQNDAFDVIPQLLESLANKQTPATSIPAEDLVSAVEKILEAKAPRAPKPLEVKK